MKPIKIFVYFVISTIMFTNLFACVPSKNFKTEISTDYEWIMKTTAEISDFDLPSDYLPEFATILNGYTFAMFKPSDSHSHLYLIQSDNTEDGEKLTSMLDQIAPGSYDPQTRMTVIETRLVTVRDQEETLVISEGTTSEGESYRQATLVFQGKGGPALLVLSEPVASWDQELIDALITSIH